MTLGEVIKKLREAKGLTQTEFAAAVGARLHEMGRPRKSDYNQSNITRLEQDAYDVTYSVQHAIAHVLGVTVADLMQLTEIPASDPLLSQWLAAYKRLEAEQRENFLRIFPAGGGK